MRFIGDIIKENLEYVSQYDDSYIDLEFMSDYKEDKKTLLNYTVINLLSCNKNLDMLSDETDREFNTLYYTSKDDETIYYIDILLYDYELNHYFSRVYDTDYIEFFTTESFDIGNSIDIISIKYNHG